MNFSNVRATNYNGYDSYVPYVCDVFLQLWDAYADDFLRANEQKQSFSVCFFPLSVLIKELTLARARRFFGDKSEKKLTTKKPILEITIQSASVYQRVIFRFPFIPCLSSGCTVARHVYISRGRSHFKSTQICLLFILFAYGIIGRRGCHRYHHKQD